MAPTIFSPEATRRIAQGPPWRDAPEPPDDEPTYSVNDRVSYKTWTGTIYAVQRDGGVLIDWHQWPGPFFHGPYQPGEIERVGDA